MKRCEEQDNFITIIRNGSQEPFKGPEKWFTRDVIVENLFQRIIYSLIVEV